MKDQGHEVDQGQLRTPPTRPQRYMTHLLRALATILALAGATRAAEPPRWGDCRMQPSPEDPVGWRGDGNGRFPASSTRALCTRRPFAERGVCSTPYGIID